MRWINRVGTVVIVAAVVVGPPLAAVLWIHAGRWRPPTVTQVSAWIEQPQAAAAALIGSIVVPVWLLLVVVIARHAVGAVVSRLRRASLPSAAQVTAGSMAGVAALAMPGIVVASPAGAAPVTTPAGTELGGAELAGPHTTAGHMGIDLPGGGWVPYRTALAVTVLGGAIWLHRRQHYRPGPWRFGQHHRDADLQPLPATTDVIIAGVDEQPPLQEVAPGAGLSGLPAGLLILHGPGAMSAARGLLITAVLGAALQADAPQTEVVLRGADLKVLLGVSISDDLPAGLRTDDAAALWGVLGSPGDGHHRQPPMLVIRQLGHERVTTVVVGDDAHPGHRWHVSADGWVTGDSKGRRRVCLLDEHAATDLLRLVQQHAASAPADPGPAWQDHARRRGQLTMLGGCRVQADGAAVHIRRSAGLQILAYLAIHPTGATTTDLVRAIWPGLDPGRITKRLHTTLTDLRQQLEPTLTDPIIRQDERYRLNSEMIETDLDKLRRAIAVAATAVTGPQRQGAARAVVDAYPGELAAGFSWPWLQSAREALRRDVIDAYLFLTAAAPAAEALDLLRAALAVDPHNEALRQQADDLLSTIGGGDAAPARGRGLD